MLIHFRSREGEVVVEGMSEKGGLASLPAFKHAAGMCGSLRSGHVDRPSVFRLVSPVSTHFCVDPFRPFRRRITDGCN